MIVVIDKEKFLGIYSDQNKKILDKSNGVLYNGYETRPIYVNKTRYANGDYEESAVECDELEEEEPKEEKPAIKFPFSKGV